MRRMLMFPSILFIAFALCACATRIPAPLFAAKDGGPTNFAGLSKPLADNGALDLVLVHGMCTHGEKWANEAAQTLFTALGGDKEAVKLKPVSVDGTGIVLHQQELPVGPNVLRINAIVWSPLTTPLKTQLCYDQTVKSPACIAAGATAPYPYPRATLNRILKDTILDDCLADAMIYQGVARDEINAQMRQALLQVVTTSGGTAKVADEVAKAAAMPPSLPLVVVTESLGSKVAFDALYKLATNPSTRLAGLRTWNRVTQIFMGANQMPILALADRRLDGTIARFSAATAPATAYPEDPIDALIDNSRRPAPDGGVGVASVKVPQVIAFTDPNDLLSFILAPSPHAAATSYPVIDVVLSNTATWFGLVEMPTTAHQGYRTNRHVLNLIAHGNP